MELACVPSPPTPLGLHRLHAYAAAVDELGARSRAKTKAILESALDDAGIDWPPCPCGQASVFAGVQRGTTKVMWKCPRCAAAGNWRMDLVTGEVDFGQAST